jgi:CheY-like chemotaxis protein
MKNTKPRILIVDDDEISCQLLTGILSKFDYTIETATNGLRALDKIRSLSFDLVLLDLLMPDMDGYELLKTMQEYDNLREIPVIVISSVREKSNVVQCIQAGAKDYLLKPYQQDVIPSRVQAVLANKRSQDLELALEKSEEREKQLQAEIQQLRKKLEEKKGA